MRLKIFVCFLALFAATTSGHIYTIDSALNYMVTRSMGTHATLSVPRFMMTVEGTEGRHYSKLGIGQSLATLPLFWLGSLVEKATPGSELFRVYSRQVTVPHGADLVTARPQTLVRLSESEGASLFFSTLTNAFVAAAVCLLFWLILVRFGVSGHWAFAGTLLLGFATPLWVYARDLFGEPLFTACLLGTVYLLAPGGRHVTGRAAALAGLACSLGILTRASFAPLIAIFAVYIALRSASIRVGAGRALTYAAFCLPGIVIFALLNRVRFGSVLLSGYHTAFDRGFSTPLYKGIVWNLLSPYRSLFLYAPIVLLGLLNLRSFARRYRAETWLLISIAAYVLVAYSGWWAWHGGWCWGPRFLVPIIPLLLIPGLAAGPGGRRRTWLALGLGVAGFLVQLGAILINYTTVYDYWIKTGVLDWAEKNIQMFSPITVHWRAVLATSPSNYDLWLVQVAKVNVGVAIGTASALAAVALICGIAIWRHRRDPRPA